MANVPRKILSKDALIIAQNQMIEQLRATIQRISSAGPLGEAAVAAAASGPQFTGLEGPTTEPGLPGMELPTFSLEEISAFTDIQPIQFVDGSLQGLLAEPTTSSGRKEGRAGSRKLQTGRRTPAKRRNNEAVVAAEQLAAGTEPATEGGDHTAGTDTSQDNAEDGTSQPRPPSDRISHLLILGSPHTRKIPLKCPLEDCAHGDYKAWDRDLLLKHFVRYHADTHPNPTFNYLCPVEGCKYLSYNEPSYALYTHIKNIHQEYMRNLEQSLADGVPVVERDLTDLQIDKLPSQVQRTRVPVLGVLNMEKTGMRCPLPVCAAGTQVYKTSGMKRLNEHFAKVHSYTHPNPIFVFCCPVADCNFSSDVGNFRVYYHLKAEHPEQCIQATGPSAAPGGPGVTMDSEGVVAAAATSTETDGQTKTVDADAGTAVPEANAAAEVTHEAQEDGDALADLFGEDVDGIQKTRIIMRGSRNMVLDPLECPIKDCPKEGFLATGTATLKRHFRRLHRQTHPNPEFVFLCPVEGCDFLSSNKKAMNIWRHTKKVHPEIWLPGTQPTPAKLTSEESAAVTEIAGDAAGDAQLEEGEEALERLPEELLRVEAVQDVLNPHTLVKPAQLRCLHPECVRPPFSGSDKVQLLRHYAHFHPEVDRLQEIIMVCPFKECGYQSVWPAKPLYYHVESVHTKPTEEAAGSLLATKATKGRKAGSNLVAGRSPVKITGRPTAAGEFWCPIPGCGFTNNVLLLLRRHVIESHSASHPNPAFIFICPLPGCSYAKQSNYQALCTHMQREHGMKREKKPEKLDSSVAQTSSSSESRRKRKKREQEELEEEETWEDGEEERDEAVRELEIAEAATVTRPLQSPPAKKLKTIKSVPVELPKKSGLRQKPVSSAAKPPPTKQLDGQAASTSNSAVLPVVGRGSSRKAKSPKRIQRT